MTNDKKKVLTSGVVNTQLSDHSLVYTILRSSAPGTPSRKICFRSLKNFSPENFVHDMEIVPFHIIDLFDELDDKVYASELLFVGVFNEHAPIKRTMIRGNQALYDGTMEEGDQASQQTVEIHAQSYGCKIRSMQNSA